MTVCSTVNCVDCDGNDCSGKLYWLGDGFCDDGELARTAGWGEEVDVADFSCDAFPGEADDCGTSGTEAVVGAACETDEIFYIVLSFHAIGQQFEGVLGANAFTFQRMHNEEGGRDIANLKAACDTVFQFNYLEEPMNVQDRFTTWLTRCIAQALDQWKLTLGS